MENERLERIAERLAKWMWRGLAPLLQDLLHEYKTTLRESYIELINDSDNEDAEFDSLDGEEDDSSEKLFLEERADDLQNQIYDLIIKFLKRIKKR